MDLSSESNDSFTWKAASHESSSSDDEVGQDLKKKLVESNSAMKNMSEEQEESSEQKIRKNNCESPKKKKHKASYGSDSDINRINANSSYESKAFNESSEINNEEESSDHVTHKKSKKKKKRKSHSIAKSDDIDQESENIDEEYLNVRAKQEQSYKLNGKQTDFNQSDLYDGENDTNLHENYMDIKVKHEKHSFVEPLPQKMKKKKSKRSVNEETDFNNQSVLNMFDESYLNMKVKEESSFAASTPHKTKKKKKSHTQSDTSQDFENGDVNISKKDKPKKSKKSKEAKILDSSRDPDHAENSDCQSSSVTEADALPGNINGTEVSLEDTVADRAITEKQTQSTRKQLPQDNSESDEITPDKNKNQHKKGSKISAVCPAATTRGTPPARRISERLVFEKDETDDELHRVTQKNAHNVLSTRMQNFLKLNPNLSPLEKSLSAAVTLDDEIWILKLPSDINIQALTNKEFTLDSQCKIKINGDTYLGSTDTDVDKVTIMTCEQNNFVIRNLKSKGIINFKRRIPKLHLQDESFGMQSFESFIPLPDTKCRHPLFGPNFKKAMKIPKHIAQRLKPVETESSEPSERKKKKKHKKEKESDEPMEVITIEPKVETEVPRKKAKKRKHTDGEDAEAPHKKTKRNKYKPDSTEAWDTEKAIEENLFNY